jgi:hypothetical protein
MKNTTSQLCLLSSLSLLLSTVAWSQERSTGGSAAQAPEFGPEVPALYAAAIAKVNQDPEYIKAIEAVRKAQKAADVMLFAKLRQIEPKIKSYADYLEQLRFPKSQPNGQVQEPAR